MLAAMRGQLFEDEDFAELYCADNGRDSVPPSLLSTALLLQTHDRVSDAEAKQRQLLSAKLIMLIVAGIAGIIVLSASLYQFILSAP